MSDALKAFLDSVAAGDDARAEKAALALGRRLAECGWQTSVGEASRRTLIDAVLPALRDMLADADPDHRWWAARGLAAVGNRTAQELLITTLADHDPDVRACAAQGLGELQADRAVPELVRSMADPSTLVSRIAADSLARIGPPAVPALIAALQEEEALARAGAARALSIIQPEQAIPALCAALDDPSAIVTHYAEEALERMGVGLMLFRP
jgi:HEAT repeat protein